MLNVEPINPLYAPLVEACKAHGISRSVAFALCKEGLIETFRIGKRRYCYIDSLHTLPDRLTAGGGVK
jgi:hypothetical protein